MAKQGRRTKKYVVVDASIIISLTHSQSPAKMKNLQRKRRNNQSSSSDRNLFPCASTRPGSDLLALSNPWVGEHALQSQSGTRCLKIRKKLLKRRN
jgi:hypothetical protein